MTGRADIEVAAPAIERLNISIDAYTLQNWPLESVRAIARAAGGGNDSRQVTGYGGGHCPEEAGMHAAMECVERYAQFRSDIPAPVAVVAWNPAREHALSPLAFGLYDAAQYAAPDFPCRPFDPTQPLEWTAVTELLDGTPHWVPSEFVYPNAPLARPPLVRETSSGTAAHIDETRARLAALCEIVERDACMLFWYRQPTTLSLAVDDIGLPALAEDIEQLRRLGYVVLIASVDYDLGVPCFLVIAMQADRFAYGLGCHPAAHQALTHAVSELCQGLAWLGLEPVPHSVGRSFAGVRLPRDHNECHQCGPGREVLRQVLARTLRSGAAVGFAANLTTRALAPAETLAAALDALAARGFRAYTCDITPPVLRDTGVHVARVLVPGLVPLHFGFDRLRLGCERLCSARAPGRLRQLLPHFLY